MPCPLRFVLDLKRGGKSTGDSAAQVDAASNAHVLGAPPDSEIRILGSGGTHLPRGNADGFEALNKSFRPTTCAALVYAVFPFLLTVAICFVRYWKWKPRPEISGTRKALQSILQGFCRGLPKKAQVDLMERKPAGDNKQRRGWQQRARDSCEESLQAESVHSEAAKKRCQNQGRDCRI